MKNSEKIYRALGEADDEYIPYIGETKRRLPLKFAAAASVTAAAAAAVIFTVQNTGFSSDRLHFENTWQDNKIYSDYVYEKSDGSEGYYESLPKIPTGKIDTKGIYVRYTAEAYGISDFDNGNPWNESMELDSLPVYKNLSLRGNAQFGPGYYTREELAKMAEKAAAALGTSVVSSEFEYNPYIKDHIIYLKAECVGEKYGVGSIGISIYGNGAISVSFGDRISGEGGVPFTDESGASRGGDGKATLFLAEKFKELLQLENPVLNFSKESYSFSGDGGETHFSLYEGSEDPVKRILNYNFNSASFFFTASDNAVVLYGIERSNKLAAAEFLGDYPIISAEKAKQMLLSSDVPPDINGDRYLKDGVIKEEDIKKTELIYNNYDEEFFLPYYQLTVEVKCDGDWITDKNLKSYCMYCVPAVKTEYFFDDINPDLDEGALAAFFSTEIEFPDGSSARKSQASRVLPSDRYPILEYDFAFLRFPGGAEDKEAENGGWIKVREGDALGNGFFVSSADYAAAWYGSGEYYQNNGEVHFYSSNIELGGSAEITGALYRVKENGDSVSAGELYFCPDSSENGKIPIIAEGEDNTAAKLGIPGGTAGGRAVYLGNIENVYLSDYPKNLFGDDDFVSVTLSLENIKLSAWENEDGTREFRTSADIAGFSTDDYSTTNVFF